MSGRYQIAVSGSSTFLLDSQTGNVFVPVKGKGDYMVWKLQIKGDVMRPDRVTRPLRTMPLEEAV